jgi:hypothetical protein
MADQSLRAIETIQVGDKIIDGYGDVRQVTKTVIRPENHQIYNIHPYGRTCFPIQATGNHPFLVIEAKGRLKYNTNFQLSQIDEKEILTLARWKKAEEIEPTDWLIARSPQYRKLLAHIRTDDYLRYKSISTTHIIPTTYGSVAKRPCFNCETEIVKEANRLTRSQISYCDTACRKEAAIKGLWRGRNCNAHTLPKKITLNRAFGLWIGWYLAEGCVSQSGNAIIFGLHVNEKEERNEILALGQSLFGLRGTVTLFENTQGATITFYSANLARFMKTLGASVYEKGLPSAWMNGPIDFLEGVVAAHVQGNGYYNNKRALYTHITSSITLAKQIVQIQQWLGRSPSIVMKKIGGAAKYTVPNYHINWMENKDRKNRVTGRIPKNTLTLTKVHRIEHHPYQGDVYCLEVEQTHCFVANGVVAHNCFDSSDGGPWLREMTLRVFNPDRMNHFIGEAVLDFNMNQPPTQFTLETFTVPAGGTTPNPLFPLIVEGTFLAVIRHLMRSYVEQPLPQGAQFGWEDRRDYQLRWKAIYDVEKEMYARWVSMAKRGQFGFGLTAQSLYSYSRGLYSPNFNRTRGFGFWGPGY